MIYSSVMRKLYFLVPGTTKRFSCGGLWAELNTVALASQICAAEIVTYRQPEAEHLFLESVLKTADFSASIFVLSWGFDVPKLINRLKKHQANIIYHAHSAGYQFQLPPDVPIIAVSRNTMGYWGQKSPNSLIYYLPNQIGTEFRNLNQPRDIDVLVQTRKSSTYLRQQLIPTLQSRCRVEIVTGYVEDLAGLFNRSRIYLYDSAEHWATSGVSEGFGLPPMEALACGCQVFSSVNHALADYLDPGFNCHKIANYSLDYDIHKILTLLQTETSSPLPESFFAPYRVPYLKERLKVILTEINAFFELRPHLRGNIPGLEPKRLRQLWLKRSLHKLPQKLKIGRRSISFL